MFDLRKIPKGQLISKPIYDLLTSPKKRTDEFDLFAFLLFTANKSNSSVRFFGESTARQSAFRFYLNFSIKFVFHQILQMSTFKKSANSLLGNRTEGWKIRPNRSISFTVKMFGWKIDTNAHLSSCLCRRQHRMRTIHHKVRPNPFWIRI